MLVISRFHRAVEPSSGTDGDGAFLEQAKAALGAFAACAGFQRGHLGRAADDPSLWTIVTQWDSVGAFRRSLSSFDVKMYAAPLLASSIEEPAAYEILVSAARPDATAGTEPVELADHDTFRAADAGMTRVGEAATDRAPRWDDGR